jgi:sulfide:quinone oxidoreductase
MSVAGKTVLILGGGFGGIVAASRLRRQLSGEHRVILVEREAAHVFAPSLLWLMIGERTPDAISRPISALAKRGIEVVRGDIGKIAPERRAVSIT